jgi:hypothetical protein
VTQNGLSAYYLQAYLPKYLHSIHCVLSLEFFFFPWTSALSPGSQHAPSRALLCRAEAWTNCIGKPPIALFPFSYPTARSLFESKTRSSLETQKPSEPSGRRMAYSLLLHCNLDLLYVHTVEPIYPMDRNNPKINGIRLLSLGKSVL